MYNYYIDLNVFCCENILYAEKSNLERISYLFGKTNINLIVPGITLIQNVDFRTMGEVNYNVIMSGQSMFDRVNTARRSNEICILLTGNRFFLTSLISILLSFNKFKLVYIGSVSNSYLYARFSLLNIFKYVSALLTEFICFFLAVRIYAAGGKVSPRFYNYCFKKKIIPFNTKYFSSYEYIDHNFRDKFDSNVIVYIGSISNQKGMEENIRFLNKINSFSDKKYRLVIIGRRIDENYNLFLNHQYVDYKGYVSDLNEMRSILLKSKFLILLSKHEGMARAPLEAMYYSTPVITNGVGTLSYCNIQNSIINVNPERLAIAAHELTFDEYCQMSKSAFLTSKLFNGKESPIIR